MMTARRSVLLTLLLALLLGGCGAPEPDPFPPFRCRMTVEVETPEGLRTGSAVREVDYTDLLSSPLRLPQTGMLSLKVRGEAVAVDLPGGRTLYALLSAPGDGHADYSAQIALDTLLPVPPGTGLSPDNDSEEEPVAPEFKAAFAAMLASREVREVSRERAKRWNVGPSEGWPLLVTFRDAADPASVVRVDPDNPAATLGEGVRIRRITLQITGDPVTVEIDNRLRWLSTYWDKPTLIPNPPANLDDPSDPELRLLGAGAFQTERSP